MATRKTYSDKLRDPRWQKKRLEVMQRDSFTCRWCLATDITLNVHHLTYNGEPWEADENHLLTICEDCHSNDHKYRKETEAELLKSLKLQGFSYEAIGQLARGFEAIEPGGDRGFLAMALEWLLTRSARREKLVDDFSDEIFNS